MCSSRSLAPPARWRDSAAEPRLRPSDRVPGSVLRSWIGPVRVLTDNRIFYTGGGRPPVFLLLLFSPQRARSLGPVSRSTVVLVLASSLSPPSVSWRRCCASGALSSTRLKKRCPPSTGTGSMKRFPTSSTARSARSFWRCTPTPSVTASSARSGRRATQLPARDNPYKEEHYRRLAYANEHYGNLQAQNGWRTDQGRIYITLGAPQTIQTYPARAQRASDDRVVLRHSHACPAFVLLCSLLQAERG